MKFCIIYKYTIIHNLWNSYQSMFYNSDITVMIYDLGYLL